eukprot:gene11127-11281_t
MTGMSAEALDQRAKRLLQRFAQAKAAKTFSAWRDIFDKAPYARSCEDLAALQKQLLQRLPLYSRLCPAAQECIASHASIAVLSDKDEIPRVPGDEMQLYTVALRLNQEVQLSQRVSLCCRIPVLRHTPLRDLYRLAGHMRESSYQPGQVLLQQGKEVLDIHFLMQGQVQILYSPEHAASPVASARPSSRALQPAAAAAAPADGTPARGCDTQIYANNPATALTVNPLGQQVAQPPVLLGVRGPGAILGDDAIRERRLAVSVVALTAVVTLRLPPQKLLTGLDALTLRLLGRLQKQQDPQQQRLIQNAIASVDDQQPLLHRAEVLQQVYDGSQAAVVRDEDNQQLLNAPCDDKQHLRMAVSTFADLRQSASVQQLVGMLRDVEVCRRTQQEIPALASTCCAPSAAGAVSDRASAAAAVARQASTAGGGYTELLEACGMAIMQVTVLPGQAVHSGSVLMGMLDDVAAAWGAVAHDEGLQLVRWSSDRWIFLAQFDPAGNFVSSISGRAFDVATKLCGAAEAVPVGCASASASMLMTDGLASVLTTSFNLQAVGGGYLLLSAKPALPLPGQHGRMTAAVTARQRPAPTLGPGRHSVLAAAGNLLSVGPTGASSKTTATSRSGTTLPMHRGAGKVQARRRMRRKFEAFEDLLSSSGDRLPPPLSLHQPPPTAAEMLLSRNKDVGGSGAPELGSSGGMGVPANRAVRFKPKLSISLAGDGTVSGPNTCRNKTPGSCGITSLSRTSKAAQMPAAAVCRPGTWTPLTARYHKRAVKLTTTTLSAPAGDGFGLRGEVSQLDSHGSLSPRSEGTVGQGVAAHRQVQQEEELQQVMVMAACKALGNAAAAEEYAAALPETVTSVNLSTAGLSLLPPLDHLWQCERLAASFNHISSLHNLIPSNLASGPADATEDTAQLASRSSTDVEVAAACDRQIISRTGKLMTAHSTLAPIAGRSGFPTSLVCLGLGHNQLEAIPAGLPAALPRLTELDLSYNR